MADSNKETEKLREEIRSIKKFQAVQIAATVAAAAKATQQVEELRETLLSVEARRQAEEEKQKNLRNRTWLSQSSLKKLQTQIDVDPIMGYLGLQNLLSSISDLDPADLDQISDKGTCQQVLDEAEQLLIAFENKLGTKVINDIKRMEQLISVCITASGGEIESENLKQKLVELQETYKTAMLLSQGQNKFNNLVRDKEKLQAEIAKSSQKIKFNEKVITVLKAEVMHPVTFWIFCCSFFAPPFVGSFIGFIWCVVTGEIGVAILLLFLSVFFGAGITSFVRNYSSFVVVNLQIGALKKANFTPAEITEFKRAVNIPKKNKKAECDKWKQNLTELQHKHALLEQKLNTIKNMVEQIENLPSLERDIKNIKELNTLKQKYPQALKYITKEIS